MSGSKQTFLRGALILLVSSVVVKIIGAVFKIPLALLIKEDGMGLFISAYTLFAFFVLASKGVSIAVSKMVSASVSVGKSREADRIFGVAALLLGVIGTAGAAALYLAPAEFLDNFVDLRAVSGIRAISPAVLFVALISAFLGYFQGKQNMIPTAVTDVIEALGKLAVGLGLAWLFIGTSTAGAAVGAIAGVTFSTLLALIFVVIMFLAGKRRRTRSAETMRSRKSIAKELLTIALPITIGASISSLASLVDMATIMNRLQTITQVTPEFIQKYASLIDGNLFQGGIYEQLANQLYGLYTGYAVQLFNMPLTMVVALSTSVLPAISGAVARGDSGSARRTTLSVIRISVLFAAPCAVGLSTLSAPVLKFIFNVTLAHDLLRTVSIAIVFVALVQVTNAILQGYGRMHIPLVNMLIGCLVKVAVNYYLVAMPHINIDGAPIGTLACYFTIAALNIICVIRITGCKFPLGDFIIKPGVSVAGMGIVVVFARNLLSAAHFPERLAVLPAIAAGVLVYTALALLTGAVAEEDVAMLPKGGLLVKHLKKLHLLKA